MLYFTELRRTSRFPLFFVISFPNMIAHQEILEYSEIETRTAIANLYLKILERSFLSFPLYG